MYLMLNIWRMTKLGDTNWKMGSVMKEYVFMGIPHLRFTWNLFLKLKKKKKDWNSLPMDMHEASFNKLDYEDLCQTKLVSKDFKEIIGSDTYHASGKEARPSKALISSFFFLIKDGSWQCSRFDCISRKWRTLPCHHLHASHHLRRICSKSTLFQDRMNSLVSMTLNYPTKRDWLFATLRLKKIKVPPLRVCRNSIAYNGELCNKFMQGDYCKEFSQWRRGFFQMHWSLWLFDLRMDKNWGHPRFNFLFEWVPNKIMHKQHIRVHCFIGWWIRENNIWKGCACLQC